MGTKSSPETPVLNQPIMRINPEDEEFSSTVAQAYDLKHILAKIFFIYVWTGLNSAITQKLEIYRHWESIWSVFFESFDMWT